MLASAAALCGRLFLRCYGLTAVGQADFRIGQGAIGQMYPHWKKTPETENDWFEALIALARYLRSPGGCPWDQERSALDFGRYAEEEAGEMVEALERDDRDHMEEEFGDTLFVMLATAAAAEEEGRFTLKSALQRAHEKMIRRHDHVFGEIRAATPEDAVAAWNKIKEREKSDRDS